MAKNDSNDPTKWLIIVCLLAALGIGPATLHGNTVDTTKSCTTEAPAA